MAVVSESAYVPVVTRGLIQGRDTAHSRVAVIVGAQITIVTDLRAVENTSPGLAVVTNSAGVPIFAAGLVSSAHTAKSRIAFVVGTDVAVIADQGLT